jgi:HK97 family phage major capsid protein
LVSVPANPNAVAVAKSLNVSRETLDVVFAKNGTKDNLKGGRDLTGEHARTTHHRKSNTMNIAQRITETQNRINGLRDQLSAHIESIDDANVTDEQTTITDGLNDQIAAQEKNLESLKRAEAAIAKATITRQPEAGGDRGSEQPMVLRGPGRLFAQPTKKIAPLDLLFKAVAVDIKHFGEGRKRGILEVLKENYGDNELGESVRTIMARMVTRAAVVPADTTTSGWADSLVQTVIGDFIEALMPLSVYPKLRERGGSFTFGRNGTISMPSRNQSLTLAGSFVAQGAPIPVRQGGFSAVTLTPKKMGVITTMTREITEHSTPQIEAILRQAMMEDTAVAIDTVLLDATAASTTRPAGLKNGISKVSPTAGGGIAAFVGDLKALVAALISATNGNIRQPVWIMNPGDVLAASLLQTTVGETPFRDELSRGTLLGYPIAQTTTGLSDMMGIIDATDFMTATGDTPQFSVSDQAVLHMEDTSPAAISTVATPNTVAAPIRSLWQTDSMAIRMILDINWAKRRSGVFQWTDTMTWN